MVALLLATCLASGGDCRFHVEAEGMSTMACQSQSQIIAAKWAGDHPNRVIKAIVCTDGRNVGRYIGRNEA